jgi:hypothetical protein
MKFLSLDFPRGTEENHEKLRMAGVPVAIRTEQLQNTILDRYRYTSLLDISSCRTTK